MVFNTICEHVKLRWATYMSAADALQQQPGDLCLPVELTLGHPQLLLCLGDMKQDNLILTDRHHVSGVERTLQAKYFYQFCE